MQYQEKIDQIILDKKENNKNICGVKKTRKK